jgi:hypothetical protein
VGPNRVTRMHHDLVNGLVYKRTLGGYEIVPPCASLALGSVRRMHKRNGKRFG